MQTIRKADHLACVKSMNIKRVSMRRDNLFPKLLDWPHPCNQLVIRLVSGWSAPTQGLFFKKEGRVSSLCSRFVHKSLSRDRITNYSQRRAQSTGLSIIYLGREERTSDHEKWSLIDLSRGCYTALIDTFAQSDSGNEKEVSLKVISKVSATLTTV